MYNKILVGYDGSENSKKALSVALEIAKNFNSCLEVVSAVHLPDFADIRDEINGIYEDARSYFEAALNEVKELAEREGVEIHTKIVVGHTVETLIEIAKKDKVDLIVVGSRGLTGLKRYLLGSVSRGIVAYAPCSVLIVK